MGIPITAARSANPPSSTSRDDAAAPRRNPMSIISSIPRSTSLHSASKPGPGLGQPVSEAERELMQAIRDYQQASGRPFRLSESLMELGVNRIAVGTLLEKLEKVVRSVSSATQFTTVTYGDFRAWNMLIARDAAYIIDLPSELLLDTPWRDICAFLTSVDYVMARPRSFPARFMLKPRMVKSRFIRGYFKSIPLDWTAIDVMEIPAMVASWEDLKAFHGVRDIASRAWLEWRIKHAISQHAGDSA